MGDRIRGFIAIPLPREVIDRARTLQAQLREAGLRMRWVRPEAMHLTLKFLGDIDRTRIGEIDQALGTAVASTGPLALSAKGLGVFPTAKKARVLWMGVAGETSLLGNLHGRLDAQLTGLGFQAEKRRFNAHLTLARTRGRLDPQLLVSCIATIGGFEGVPFKAGKIVLYQSDLKSSGAVYTALAARDLK
ncbi:MAG: RNA 2',3'-cyclic phosphodiesterase [Desulfobacterales bacterium]|nr:RNA 2',3'-cyclic phosphodiesterase [Desulfobacterales bacterium]